MRNRFSKKTRRGSAPLELVLGLPFVMFLIASMFAIGKVGLAKQSAAIATRQHTWEQRLEPHRRSSELELQEFREPDIALAVSSIVYGGSGILRGEAKEDVAVPNWLGGNASPRGRTALVVRTWSHRQVDMSSSRPHFDLIWRMGQNPGDSLRMFDSIFSIGR